ncbi:hypothetical protein [Edaphovirga cremea]|uniref:hypothetical protein n=1 Tax=Edaphovirga cremea TaxID=2267246 RepID=UPI00398968C4
MKSRFIFIMRDEPPEVFSHNVDSGGFNGVFSVQRERVLKGLIIKSVAVNYFLALIFLPVTSVAAIFRALRNTLSLALFSAYRVIFILCNREQEDIKIDIR